MLAPNTLISGSRKNRPRNASRDRADRERKGVAATKRSWRRHDVHARRIVGERHGAGARRRRSAIRCSGAPSASVTVKRVTGAEILDLAERAGERRPAGRRASPAPAGAAPRAAATARPCRPRCRVAPRTRTTPPAERDLQRVAVAAADDAVEQVGGADEARDERRRRLLVDRARRWRSARRGRRASRRCGRRSPAPLPGRA